MSEMASGNGRPRDLTVAILREIRDEVRKTNERLDQTNERLDRTNDRLDQTNERLSRLEHAFYGLTMRFEHFLDTAGQAWRETDRRIEALERRVGALEGQGGRP